MWIGSSIQSVKKNHFIWLNYSFILHSPNTNSVPFTTGGTPNTPMIHTLLEKNQLYVRQPYSKRAPTQVTCEERFFHKRMFHCCLPKSRGHDPQNQPLWSPDAALRPVALFTRSQRSTQGGPGRFSSGQATTLIPSEQHYILSTCVCVRVCVKEFIFIAQVKGGWVDLECM